MTTNRTTLHWPARGCSFSSPSQYSKAKWCRWPCLQRLSSLTECYLETSTSFGLYCWGRSPWLGIAIHREWGQSRHIFEKRRKIHLRWHECMDLDAPLRNEELQILYSPLNHNGLRLSQGFLDPNWRLPNLESDKSLCTQSVKPWYVFPFASNISHSTALQPSQTSSVESTWNWGRAIPNTVIPVDGLVRIERHGPP